MKSEWKQRIISVAMNTNGTTRMLSVEADARGALAVVRLRGASSGWSLTHIPTGYAIGWMPTKRATKALADDLLATEVDWELLTLDDVRRTSEIPALAAAAALVRAAYAKAAA